jgi:hypothetical protein
VERIGEETGKDFPGRGVWVLRSPQLKLGVLVKRRNLLSTTPAMQFSNISDNGALRGMKSLAREKS